MEKINLRQLLIDMRQDEFRDPQRLSFLLCHLIGKMPKGEFDKLQKKYNAEEGYVYVECKIFGQEVSIAEFCKFIMGQWSDSVDREAKKLVEQEINNIRSTLNNFINDLYTKFDLEKD